MHLIGVHTFFAPRDSYGPLCVGGVGLQTKTCQEVTVHHLCSNPAEDCMKFNIKFSVPLHASYLENMGHISPQM